MDGRNSEVWKSGDACPAVISRVNFVENLTNLSVKKWNKMVNALEKLSKTVYDKNGQNISKGVKR